MGENQAVKDKRDLPLVWKEPTWESFFKWSNLRTYRFFSEKDFDFLTRFSRYQFCKNKLKKKNLSKKLSWALSYDFMTWKVI